MMSDCIDRAALLKDIEESVVFSGQTSAPTAGRKWIWRSNNVRTYHKEETAENP